MRDRRHTARGLFAGATLLLLYTSCSGEQATTVAVRDIPSAARASGGTPPAVQAISITPSTVNAGATATGTVTLASNAPSGGAAVSLSSNNTSVVTVPSSVTVPAGAKTASFVATSHPVAAYDFAAISANSAGVTVTAVLNVLPSGSTAASLTLSPTLIPSGATSTGTVTLSAPAPAGGAVITLGSSDVSRATVPASVTAPAGSTTATFIITAGNVPFGALVYISAAYGGVTQIANLIVTEAAPVGAQVASLTITPDIIVGGLSAQGTVTIGSAVGSATSVVLASFNTAVARVPASVTVPAGATSATFTIATSAVPVGAPADFAQISAEAGGTTRFASITTTSPPIGPFIKNMVFAPTSVGGGGPVTGIITLKSPATQGGEITLVSSRPDIVQVPATTVVSANTSVAYFPVTTSRVGANVNVTVSATACCGTQGNATAILTVTTAAPPPPDVVTIQSAQFRFVGGRGGLLEVKARSTKATAILTAFPDGTTESTRILTNKGGGLFEGSFQMHSPGPNNVTVKSNLGGSATARVR